MKFTGRTYGVATTRRANPRSAIPPFAQWKLHVRHPDTGFEERRYGAWAIHCRSARNCELWSRTGSHWGPEFNAPRHTTAAKIIAFLNGAPRRNPPMLAILNPLPPHLERFAKAQRLNADERAEFNQAIARYCEFHDVGPETIKVEPWGEVEGGGTRFLVGLGKAEDVSYSVNTKGRFRGSNKKGTPYRHKIEAESTMLATTPDGEMTLIINKPGAKRKMVVQDWLRG